MNDNKKLRIWLIISQSDPKVLLNLRNKFSRFEDKYDVKIQIEFVTWERVLKALIEAFKNDTAPDIVQLGTSWVRTFAHMGYLDLIPDNINVKPSINEDINNLCKYKGKRYAVPWIVDTVMMVGRRDYMTSLGIDQNDVKDWQGLKQVAEELVERKKENPAVPKPLSIALKVENDTLQRIFSILWSRGWEFPDLKQVPDKLVTDSLVLDTIKYYASLKIICDNSLEEVTKHPFQVNDDFYRYGKSMFYIGSWYGIVDRIKNEKYEDQKKDNYCVLPFPTSLKKPHSYGGGTVLSVSSKSKQKMKAWRLIEDIISEDFISEFDIGNAPAFECEFWQKRFEDKRVKLMYEQTINSKIYPPHPAWIAVEDKIIKGIGFTLLDLIKKKETKIDERTYSFLHKTDQEIKRILKTCWEMND